MTSKMVYNNRIIKMNKNQHKKHKHKNNFTM